MWDQIALVMSIILPLWNIPLIFRIIQRKSSKDISTTWAVGVWVCFVLMFPAAVMSDELIWKVFNIMNLFLFSIVVGVVLIYRKK